MDSREIAEWQAFEQALGPIGPEYSQGALAAIHEQLQTVSWLLGAEFEENPVPEPKHWPRPNEVFSTYEEQQEQAQAAEPVAGADELNAFFDNL